MTKSFGSLVFTPVVKALQERYGSRRQYARAERMGDAPGGLGQSSLHMSVVCDVLGQGRELAVTVWDSNER